jgi:fibronectin type 3 domain-containing protein
VVVRAHPAPAAVSNVTARVAGQSVTLTWPPEDNISYRVYRAEIAPESVAAASANAANAVLRMPLVQVAQTSASTDGGSGSLQYRDENVVLGHAYLYILRAVSQFGSDTVESADSAPAAITVAEPVPPAAPQDLEAVVLPAAGTARAYVSLSWAINSEAGAAGYAIYRSEQEGVRGVRINPGLAGSPTYRDDTVTAGQQYFYSVTAVDAAGLESEPSSQVAAQP